MSSLIWNGTVQHSHRRLNTSPLHSLRSSRHASSHDTRNFRSSAPFFEFTPNEWTIILEKQQSLAWRCTCWRDFTPYQWQNLLRHQPTLLHYCEILDHPAVRSGLLASDSYFSTDIDTHDFTLCDWFWGVKHNPGIGYNCPCQEQFTKSMWWSILYSSAELLPDCPYLYLFSDEDWRRLNLFPKLKSRIRNGEQFRKLIALTRHSFRTHISDEVTQL